MRFPGQAPLRCWSRRATVAGLGAILAFSAASSAQSTPRPTPQPATRPAVSTPSQRTFKASQFLRFVDDKDRPRLEVSIVTLKGADGFTVDLVSAVHVADQSYFQDLNHRFPGYDAVLYEMVKPKGFEMPAPKKEGEAPAGVQTGSMVSMFQRFLTDVLKLSFQLDAVDYSARNFLHADMDAETFERRQEERGESLVGLMLKSMLNGMAQGQNPGEAPPPDGMQLLWAMSQPDSHRQLKLIMAKAFGQIESQLSGLDGPKGSVILTERNDACLTVLRQARRQGKKRVAIFFGAAHMPDMAQKLVTKDGLKLTGTEWLTAWDMTPPPPAAAGGTTQPSTRPARR